MGHNHGAHDHHGSHSHEPHGHAANAPLRSLKIALLLTLGFAVVEVFGGLWAGSLALISDAGHMTSDALSLGVALLAGWVARRPASSKHTYGLARAEVIGAAINGLFMLVVIGWICKEAIERFSQPTPVAGGAVMLIAAGGLAVNLIVAKVLSHGEQGINTRAAYLHVMGDLLGSVAALIAGAVVLATGWTPIDPLLSLLVAGLVLSSSMRLLKEALNVLMEAVPANLDLQAVGQAMATVEGVKGVHDLHLWTAAAGRPALSAHIEVSGLAGWPAILIRLQHLLRQRFGIDHVTLQPELVTQGPRTPGKVVAIHERR